VKPVLGLGRDPSQLLAGTGQYLFNFNSERGGESEYSTSVSIVRRHGLVVVSLLIWILEKYCIVLHAMQCIHPAS
jgi:hypothetical protein